MHAQLCFSQLVCDRAAAAAQTNTSLHALAVRCVGVLAVSGTKVCRARRWVLLPVFIAFPRDKLP
jgi:hypothetical protein